MAAVALLVAAPAAADDASPEALARAREEYRRGLALEQAGDWEGALVVFKGVALVRSTPQVRFHVAQCEEKVGNWVEALGSYRLALAEAQQGRVAEVEREAAAAIAALAPRIPTITIVRGTGAAAATVLLDGRELGPATVGTPIAVNPGPHRVEASSPGRIATVREILVEEGKAAEVALTLAPQRRRLTAPEPDEETTGEPSLLLPVGLASLGVGVASLGASAVFLGLRQSAIDDLDAACGDGGRSCPESLRDTADRGATFATASTVTFVAGATCVVLGGTLLAIELATSPDTARGDARAQIGVGLGGLSLTGAF